MAIRRCKGFEGRCDSCVRDGWQASLFDPGMEELCKYVAERRFISVNERPAGIAPPNQAHGRRRPRRSVPYMSLKQRLPQIRRLLRLKLMLRDLASLSAAVHHNWLCLQTVGLSGHPSVQGLRGSNSFPQPRHSSGNLACLFPDPVLPGSSRNPIAT